MTTIDRRTFLTGTAATAGIAGLGLASAAPAHAQTWTILNHDYQVQETGYWCGPAATRIALSCRGVYQSQASLASQLGTTTNGTDYIGQVTGVLANHVGWYETKNMPNDPPTQAQKDLLWNDISYNIDRGYALVANIVAPPGNQPPGYPSNQTIYHYFTIIGYNRDPAWRQAYIADPANFGGNNHYWLWFDQLASLIPPKGYSA
ncbi:C39 family peptidase [Luteipulveratus halotolerans]|uniref:Lysis protein n=1 Tax=Luteipulveratus halotolerans TaxID=1631356 RepID=A0A0L6CHM6_9MICO|nr:C39 family peptidase [Luteipulveratus halotolerans]KNX37018.1 lysis protein [Luteipulveratus halotolerans]